MVAAMTIIVISVIQNGYVAESIYRDDRDDRWRQRYNRIHSYDDDVYYRECRDSPDPAGIIAGGLIGGLLGNAAGDGRAGATIAGVVIGGAIGSALTNNLDCEDRSYAYRTYYDGSTRGVRIAVTNGAIRTTTIAVSSALALTIIIRRVSAVRTLLRLPIFRGVHRKSKAGPAVSPTAPGRL